MSSKSKARLPADPLISMRIAFLRPLAKRVASKTPRAPPRNSREEDGGVVHGDGTASGAGRPGQAGVLGRHRPLVDERVQAARDPADRRRR